MAQCSDGCGAPLDETGYCSFCGNFYPEKSQKVVDAAWKAEAIPGDMEKKVTLVREPLLDEDEEWDQSTQAWLYGPANEPDLMQEPMPILPEGEDGQRALAFFTGGSLVLGALLAWVGAPYVGLTLFFLALVLAGIGAYRSIQRKLS